MRHKPFSILALVMVLALVLSACATGGGDQPTDLPGVGGETTEPMATDVMEEPTEMMEEPTEVMEEPTMAATEAMEEPTAVATTTAGGVPSTGEIDCLDAQPGDTVTMLYQWSGVEEEKLNSILQPLADECGIVFQPESTRDQALLDTRVNAGTPPDIAFWNVVQLRQYVDQLMAVDEDLGVDPEVYRGGWVENGSVEGKWVGLPVKGDIKTIIWYSPANFEALGYTVPTTWDELEQLVEQMVADGQVPWSMGFEAGDATGWTGTDWIEDILLVTQGPEFVQGLIDGSVSYDDPAVAEAYEIYGRWARDPQYTIGGAQGTLSTTVEEAIYAVFADPPQAMMVRQSGFAGGLIAAQYPDFEYGVDYDFFQVPDAQGIQTGSDWMMAFSDKPAVQALYHYVASDVGAQNWAAATFDISPVNAAAGGYTDESLSKRADILYESEGTVPDIGDSITGGFGSVEFRAIADYVNGAELDQVLSTVAEAQRAGTSQ